MDFLRNPPGYTSEDAQQTLRLEIANGERGFDDAVRLSAVLLHVAERDRVFKEATYHAVEAMCAFKRNDHERADVHINDYLELMDRPTLMDMEARQRLAALEQLVKIGGERVVAEQMQLFDPDNITP